jgi:adenosylcobinamide-GDP ribazoletransferase
MAVVDEVRAAVGCLTLLEGAAKRASREAIAGGLAFHPLVGLGLGAVAAAVAVATGRSAPVVAAPASVLVLLVLTRARGAGGLAAAAEALLRPGPESVVRARMQRKPGALGIVVALAALVARIAALFVLPPATRTGALLVAPMLGAWAIVVQCYGGVPGRAGGPAAALVGRARFREFGWASVTAIGVTLAIGDAVGLVLVLAAAGVTVGLRVYAYRRLGGLTGRLLAATRELVETVVLVTLGCLARLNG